MPAMLSSSQRPGSYLRLLTRGSISLTSECEVARRCQTPTTQEWRLEMGIVLSLVMVRLTVGRVNTRMRAGSTVPIYVPLIAEPERLGEGISFSNGGLYHWNTSKPWMSFQRFCQEPWRARTRSAVSETGGRDTTMRNRLVGRRLLPGPKRKR